MSLERAYVLCRQCNDDQTQMGRLEKRTEAMKALEEERQFLLLRYGPYNDLETRDSEARKRYEACQQGLEACMRKRITDPTYGCDHDICELLKPLLKKEKG